MVRANVLKNLVSRIDNGRADTNDKIEAVELISRTEDLSFVPLLLSLLGDSDGEVRYYALRALVLELQVKDSEAAELCWDILKKDSDEWPRRMAATCLGSIYFGSCDKMVFDRLLAVLRDEHEEPYVRRACYSALFKVAGRPPEEWPDDFLTSKRSFRPHDVDWERVVALQALVGIDNDSDS